MAAQTANLPLRVAIVGSGPSGFYAAEHLLKADASIEIDILDRLPTPFGLVRGGVAPDHQKIKSVIKVYDRIAGHPKVRFFGNVTLGTDLSREDLRARYHAVIYAVGAQSDRALGIPGEHLPGSHAATEFVGWYNGHPDYRDLTFDLTQENVAVVGMGNVAIDVTRVLARTHEELCTTDIAPYALEALRHSRVKNIYMLGRRGPVQAAFTNPEIKELGEMPGADIVVSSGELELDEHSAGMLAQGEDRTAERNLHTLTGFARRKPAGKSRRIHLRFLVSPIEIMGRERVEAIRLVQNRLVPDGKGDVRAEPTAVTETIPVGLVFRSVGYRGLPLEGLPFDAKRGIIPNQAGRVLVAPDQAAAGEYVVGWIKRGPTGVIGTNKPDAGETVAALLEDASRGTLHPPRNGSRDSLERLLEERRVQYVTYDDWRTLDELERKLGQAEGRIRTKFCRVSEMLEALGAARSGTARSA